MSRKRRLTDAEIVSLRRSIGLPDDGPTPDQHREWSRIEYMAAQRDEGQVIHADH